MKKVITYGTFDLLHYGHIKLLERAKELGDYLVVGVTSDDFDKRRGKINVQQSLSERIKSVKETGLADEIIIEEYEGQKIDDIINLGIDVFTVGSDWKGKFDYLNEYCDVIYLDRTKGISSTELRNSKKSVKMGVVGDANIIKKYIDEINYVNGIDITSVIYDGEQINEKSLVENLELYDDYFKFLDSVDAVYIGTNPNAHYNLIKAALYSKKNVLYEPPLSLSVDECNELYDIAKENNLVLMEAMKTNYSQSYRRLILLAKSGVIGDIISVDSTCTSLSQFEKLGEEKMVKKQNSMCAWGPVAMLPVFQLLGTDYKSKNIVSLKSEYDNNFDLFTSIDFIFDKAVGRIKIAKGVKSEGDLIISGTKGYIYVPSPWWKTDYFEVRYEDSQKNKRYFYQLDGEGIRYELVNFYKAITIKYLNNFKDKNVSLATAEVIEDYYNKEDIFELKSRGDSDESKKRVKSKTI